MTSPSAATSFVGREVERQELLALTARGRVLTLIGPGGSGKTRLAVRLFDDLAPGYGDRCWSVGLADCHDPDLVRATVASEVGMSAPGAGRDAPGLPGFLGPEPALLLLDNCEHLVLEAAALVSDLTAHCPGLVVLTTSRMPLGIAAERVYPVGPLVEADALALFLERARGTLPGFAITPENAGTVSGIIAALDRIPLAVELAAARLRSLAPEVLLARLGAPLDILAQGPRDAAHRHQTMEASVAWSYELCSPEEQAMWRRISVFAGGFDLEAAESVWAEVSAGSSSALDLVSALVDQSVLSRDPYRPQRYLMLEVIRHYGLRRLEGTGEDQDARRRHLDWCKGLATEFAASWFGPDQIRWLDRIRADQSNVRVALDFAIADDAEGALTIFSALDAYWTSSGHFAEGSHWNRRIRALETGPAHLRARLIALNVCGEALRGQLGLVDASCAAAATLLEADQDPGASALLQFAYGMVAIARRDAPGALEAFERSADLFAVAGEPYGRARAQYHRALTLQSSGQTEAGMTLAREVLADSDRVGELRAGAYALWVLGMDAIADPPVAEELHRKALDRAGRVGDQLGTALFLEMLAWVVALRGEPDRSAGLVGAADAVWRTMGMSATNLPQIAALIESGVFTHRTNAPVDHQTDYERGSGLAATEAVAFALGESDPEAPASTANGSTLAVLTRREAEVARKIADGLSNRGIADSLHLSERTVHGHVQSALRKLGFSSRVQIAAWVLRAELGSD